ncbi:hypothetical protein E1B25_03100 [Antarcticimicrobium sediminis]|uniref:DUF4157 domain-containing protein n=2 Tax=Antarcticimicrobium sediminis TaxID=2546227 RepID=A0A4R5F271_9RHOB|nr:hypothetical protein E1B25_03100 [Antarcticimicrobium sediminis]
MRLVSALTALAVLASCGRPLTEREMAFAQTLQGRDMALDRVRLVRGAPVGTITFHRKPRPPVTCRERIAPPETDAVITTRPAAVTLFNRIFFSKEWYVADYTPTYPDQLYLVEAMLLAHELTHVWQWQNRARTGYTPLRAAAEHGAADPYLFDLTAAPRFQSFGYEQQGAIVEEFVCCRALAPQAARTKRLHQMLSQAFPVAPLPKTGRESDVYLPWNGVKIEGICD